MTAIDPAGGLDGYLEGDVTIDLDTLMAEDFDGCLDELARRLCGTTLLHDLTCRPVGVAGGPAHHPCVRQRRRRARRTPPRTPRPPMNIPTSHTAG